MSTSLYGREVRQQFTANLRFIPRPITPHAVCRVRMTIVNLYYDTRFAGSLSGNVPFRPGGLCTVEHTAAARANQRAYQYTDIHTYASLVPSHGN
jgi:hypothetical protein